MFICYMTGGGAPAKNFPNEKLISCSEKLFLEEIYQILISHLTSFNSSFECDFDESRDQVFLSLMPHHLREVRTHYRVRY